MSLPCDCTCMVVRKSKIVEVYRAVVYLQVNSNFICQLSYSCYPDEYAGLRYSPKLTDLMNEIAVKFPDKWQDIGRGLGLEEYELKQIHEEHGWQQSTNVFFSSAFEKWHSGE